MKILLVFASLALFFFVWWLLWRISSTKKKSLTPQEQAFHDFLVVKNRWSTGWTLYKFIITLPCDARLQRDSIVQEVSMHFGMRRFLAEALIAKLEKRIREHGDKTISVVLLAKEEGGRKK
jgi:hypothetical protein